MGEKWYYVQGSDRIGPVEKNEIENLFHSGVLNSESYIWKKGFDNWKKMEEVSDFEELLKSPNDPTDVNAIPSMDEFPPRKSFDLENLKDDVRVITIKVGYDRRADDTEYGPFSIAQLRQAYQENRINEKTFIFVPGMDTWKFLAETPFFERVTGTLPPVLDEEDRRVNPRKPFVARMLFHDNTEVLEGVCRDISVGGLQVLVSDFPVGLGDTISMNVHPENSDFSFVAKGVVVRILDGNAGFSLRFESLPDEAEKAIQSYIQHK